MNSAGQGCGIGVSVISAEDSIRVSLVYDDSPAAGAGIQKGDYITGAEGLTVAADGADAVIDAIQGEAGTEVTVSVQKDGTDEVQRADHGTRSRHAEDGVGRDAGRQRGLSAH